MDKSGKIAVVLGEEGRVDKRKKEQTHHRLLAAALHTVDLKSDSGIGKHGMCGGWRTRRFRNLLHVPWEKSHRTPLFFISFCVILQLNAHLFY